MKEIMSMTQNFVRVATEKEGDYINLKSDNFELLEPTNGEVEHFEMAMFNGYHGTTLSFRTKSIYDIYRVYDGDKLVLETEDEIVELPNGYVPDTNTKVYAYERNIDKLILRGVGEYGGLIPDRFKKKKNYKLSVFVPLYNSELFMCRTIDSILSSTLDSIELIMIDDGSKDKTREIAQWYADCYKCVSVYHQDNQGVAVTRNKGMNLAKGEYLAFCDNDDIIHPFMYEKLYNACKEYNTDIAIAKTLVRTDFEQYYRHPNLDGVEGNVVIYSFDDMFNTRGVKGKTMFRVAVWNKIVKTEVAKKTTFPEGYGGPGVLYEDVAYTSSLYSYIDKFVFVKDAHYTWDKRKQMTVGTASTWHKDLNDNEYVWQMFIYSYSRPLYHRNEKNAKLSDFTHFKRLIDAYDKFRATPSPMRDYWERELNKIINFDKMYDNELIMGDDRLRDIVQRFR